MAFSLFGKTSNQAAEYKRFKKALEKNPGDLGLKDQFVKFCLLNRFTNQEGDEDHIAEALDLFALIQNREPFDLQCHYLVGKYYQEERDFRKAYGVYLEAIKRFNYFAQNSPTFRADNSELAYSVALNLMALQSDPVDPHVEVCFKIIRKSFPLHQKSAELDAEMAKPAPNKMRIRKLSDEIKKLRDEEEKEAQAETAKRAELAQQPASVEQLPQGSESAQAQEPSPEPTPAVSQPAPSAGPQLKGLFSKLFNELSPESMGLSGLSAEEMKKVQVVPAKGEKTDHLNLPPMAEKSTPGSSFLAFHDNKWEGPFTPAELGAKGFLKTNTWVCRKGSQQVIQAYEVPDLQPVLKK
jgi:tetratricopeptide (TPR) repeat protein